MQQTNNSTLPPRSNAPTIAVSGDDFRPEWVTVNQAIKLFAISRSRLYELIRDGSIKSCSDRKRGNIRGRRRILADSVRDYLNALAATQEMGSGKEKGPLNQD